MWHIRELLLFAALLPPVYRAVPGGLTFPSEVIYLALGETSVPCDSAGVQLPTALRYDAASLARRRLFDRLVHERYAGRDFGCVFFRRDQFVLGPDGTCRPRSLRIGERSHVHLGGPFRAADVLAFLRTRATGGPPPSVAADDVAGAADAAKYWTADAQLLIEVAIDCRLKEAIPILTDLLRDDAMHVAAARALAQFGSDAAPAVPALSARLERAEPGGRSPRGSMAAIALSTIGRDAHAALLRIINDPADDRRSDALWALAGSVDRPDLRPLLPFLMTVIEDTGPIGGDVPRPPAVSPLAALAALRTAGPDGLVALPLLARRLKTWMAYDLRRAAIPAIAAMGPEAIPLLVARMIDFPPLLDERENELCADELLDMGDVGRAAIFRAVSYWPDRVLWVAAQALRSANGERYVAARPLVFLCLTANDPGTREEALWAIECNEPPAVVVESLLREFRRPDADNRRHALHRLASVLTDRRFSPFPLPADVVGAAASDPDERVRDAAKNLLDVMRSHEAESRSSRP